jgi:hypothetical protein
MAGDKEVRPVLDFNQLVPDELMAIGLTGVQIASIASGIGTVINAALAVDMFLKGTPSFEEVVQAKLTAIEQKLDQYYLDLVGLQRATAFSNSRQNIDILMAPLIGGALAVHQWATLNKNAPNADTLRFEPIGMGTNEVASRNALIALAGNSFFEQPTLSKPLGDAATIEQAKNLGIDPPSWAYWPNSTPAVNEFGLAFDYRLGVPALLAGIPLRLKVITGNAPDFARTGIYDAELSIYANRLRWAVQMIEAGILTRRRFGAVRTHGYVPVGKTPSGQTIHGGIEYEASLTAEAACLHTGARAWHTLKGTFSGQTVFSGGYCPVSYGAINDYACDNPTHAERLLFERALKDKHHHGSGADTLQAMARSKLLHHLGVFEIHAMIDLLETLMDRNVNLVRPKIASETLFWPHGLDGVIQSHLNGGCLEVVNGSDESGAGIAVAPMDHTAFRTRQKWTYDRVSGQVRSDLGTCLAVDWNHYNDHGPIFWSPSGYDTGIARGVRVTTVLPIGQPGELNTDPANLARAAQRWTYNPRTKLLRNALGGATMVLDVMWGNPAPGTRTWVWDVNGSAAQRWKSQRPEGFWGLADEFLDIVTKIAILTKKGAYTGRFEEGPKLHFDRIDDDAHHLLDGLARALAGPHAERGYILDLRESADDLQFPLRLPVPRGAGKTGYIVVFADGRFEPGDDAGSA